MDRRTFIFTTGSGLEVHLDVLPPPHRIDRELLGTRLDLALRLAHREVLLAGRPATAHRALRRLCLLFVHDRGLHCRVVYPVSQICAASSTVLRTWPTAARQIRGMVTVGFWLIDLRGGAAIYAP